MNSVLEYHYFLEGLHNMDELVGHREEKGNDSMHIVNNNGKRFKEWKSQK